MGEFQDNVVVITGGNSGIGLAAAEQYHATGARVIITGRNPTTLKQTEERLPGLKAYQADVSKVSSLKEMFADIGDEYGKINVLVVNAGIAGRKPLSDIDEELFNSIIDINYKGAFYTVQQADPYLAHGASIVFTSSVAGHMAYKEHLVYSTIKAAISQMTKNLAADLVERKIRVNAVSPGYTETPLFDGLKEKVENYVEQRSANFPLKRFATAEEIANAIYFLSSEKASYITGVDLLVDGGMSTISPFGV